MDISWAFNTPVTFKRFSKSDGWGSPERETVIPISVWWEKTHKIIKTANGEEKKGSVVVLGPLSLEPKENDLFIRGGIQYRVLTVSEPTDIYSETSYFSAVLEEVIQ